MTSPSRNDIVNAETNQVGPSTGPHSHVLKLNVNMNARDECRVAFRNYFFLGSAVGGMIGYSIHNYAMKNKWPKYVNMTPGMKAVVHGGYILALGYLTGLALENSCRKVHGLPKVDFMRKEKTL